MSRLPKKKDRSCACICRRIKSKYYCETNKTNEVTFYIRNVLTFFSCIFE